MRKFSSVCIRVEEGRNCFTGMISFTSTLHMRGNMIPLVLNMTIELRYMKESFMPDSPLPDMRYVSMMILKQPLSVF